MAQIRLTMKLDVPLGVLESEEKWHCWVTPTYLAQLVKEANCKMQENQRQREKLEMYIKTLFFP